MIAKYKIVEDTAILYMKQKNKSRLHRVLIDAEDLYRIIDSEYKWYICLTNKKRVWGYSNKKYILLYRFIMNALDSDLMVDHINGKPWDCRKNNLRLLDRSGNLQNVHNAKCNSKARIRGVSWNSRDQNWSVRIRILDGRYKHFGYFDSLEEAALVAERVKAENQPTSPEYRRRIG